MCVHVLQQENRANSPSSIMHGRQVSIPPSVHHSPPNQLPMVSASTQEDLWHLPGRLRKSKSLKCLKHALFTWEILLQNNMQLLQHPLPAQTSPYLFIYLLGINPSLWDKEDVAHWLHWAQKEYSLRRPEKGRFEMNGRALCLLTKEDFRRRCPSSGRNECACKKESSTLTDFCACVFTCAPSFPVGDVLYEILQCVKQQRRSVVCEPQDTSPSPANGHSQSPVSCQVPTHSVQEQQAPAASDTQGQ